MNMQLVLLAIYCYTIYCYIKILTITAFKTTVHEIYDVKCYILLLNCITISTSATLGLIYKCLIVLLQFGKNTPVSFSKTSCSRNHTITYTCK